MKIFKKLSNPFASANKFRVAIKQRDDAEQSLQSAEATVTQQERQIEHLEQEVKEAPYRAREELIGQYGIRIGWQEFDLQAIQAKIRAVEPSLRIERENFRWVFYAARAMDQAQMNRLESKLGFKLERG